jgi:sec-independent protein translocase protein TatA
MLGLDNPLHIAFILIVLLLVFGAKRLPEMGKSMGEGLRGFKDSISGESQVSHMTAQDAPRVDELAAAVPTTTPTAPERAPVAIERAVERSPLTPTA